MEEREAFLMDLGKLLGLLCRRAKVLLLTALLGMALAVLGTWLLAVPQYTSTVMIYVNTTQSAKNLADSFEVVVKMRETLMEVIQHTGIDTNHTALQKKIRVASVKETDFFQITVSDPSAYEARDIARVIGQLLPERVASIMEGTSIKVVGEPIPALEPSSPSYPNVILLGGSMGLMIGIGAVLYRELVTKKNPEGVENAVIPRK